MNNCVSCIHTQVCGIKKNYEIAKSLIKLPANYDADYPFASITFYCVHYRSQEMCLYSQDYIKEGKK